MSATPPGFQTIPTGPERNGDFSAFPQLIYDPQSATGTGVRQQFPGNVIPASRISKISQSFQSYLPATTNSAITNNYLATLPNKVNNDSTTDKIDYNLSDKNRLYVLYSYGKYANPIVGSLTPISTSTLPVPYTDGRGVIEYATLAQLHDSHIIRLHLVVNQFSAGVSHLFIHADQQHAERQLSDQGGTHGPAAGNRQHGFSGHQFRRQQRSGELGRDQLACFQ